MSNQNSQNPRIRKISKVLFWFLLCVTISNVTVCVIAVVNMHNSVVHFRSDHKAAFETCVRLIEAERKEELIAAFKEIHGDNTYRTAREMLTEYLKKFEALEREDE